VKTEVIKEFLVGLGFKIDEAGMARFVTGISKATVAVTAMGAATTAAAAAVFAGINSVASEYYQLERLGVQFRSTAESMDQFIDSAQVLGIKNDTAIDSLRALDRAIVDTSMGIGRTKLVFENLGISVVDATGKIKPTTQVMGELAELFKTMERGKQLRVMERLGIDASFVKLFMADLDTINADLNAIDQSVGLDFEKAVKESKAFTIAFRVLQQETQKWRILFAKAMDVIAVKMMPRIRNTMEGTRQSMIRLRRMTMDVMPMIISKIVPVIGAILRIAEAFVSIASRIASAVGTIISWIVRLNSATNGLAGYIIAAAVAWRYLNLAFLRTPLGQLISLATVVALLIDDFLTFREGGDSLIDWGNRFGVVMKVVTSAMALFLAGVVATKAWVTGVAIATNAWAVATGVLNGVLATVRTAVLLFNMAISLNPIGATILAISALIGAGIMLVKNWDTVKRWFSSFFGFLGGGFEKISNVAGKIASVIGVGGMRPSLLTPSPQAQATMTARAQSVNQRTQIVVNGNADPSSTARAVAGQQTRVNADMARNMRVVAR
jgi:hypothetical protein